MPDYSKNSRARHIGILIGENLKKDFLSPVSSFDEALREVLDDALRNKKPSVSNKLIELHFALSAAKDLVIQVRD